MSRARAAAAVAVISLCVIAESREAFAIERRVESDGVVFVSRPARKPGSSGKTPLTPATKLPKTPTGFAPLVNEISRKHGLDPSLVAAVIGVESGFNPRARSLKGAQGLMQLMPATAREYGVKDPWDPRENIEGGVAYLKSLLRRYEGDMQLALAAYNAGPEAVLRASGVPHFRETREYLVKIESRYGQSLRKRALHRTRPDGTQSAGIIQVSRSVDGVIVATNRPGKRTERAGKGVRGR